MSICQSNFLIIEEKLAGRFQSSLECERVNRDRESDLVASQAPKARTTGTASESIDFHATRHLSDREFLEQAYLALFHRAADPSGMESHLSQLQAGVDRRVVLAQLRYSPEGQQVGTRVKGLGMHALYFSTRARVTGVISRLKQRKP